MYTFFAGILTEQDENIGAKTLEHNPGLCLGRTQEVLGGKSKIMMILLTHFAVGML
jgi:hypothetical protein